MTPEEMKTLTTAVVNELKALVAMEVASVTPPDHPLDALAAHIRLMTIREERAHYADMHRRAQHEKILTAMVTNLDVTETKITQDRIGIVGSLSPMSYRFRAQNAESSIASRVPLNGVCPMCSSGAPSPT